MMNNIYELLEEYKDARRNAFVTALTISGTSNHIAGIFGVNIPREILWALDIVPINIYSNDGSNIDASEEVIQKENCSLIKASYGYAITNKCPLTHFADIIIGNDMCPNKLSMLKKLGNFKKLYILRELDDVDKLVLEYKKLVNYLEQEFNVKINSTKLSHAIKKTNDINKKTQELIKLFMVKPNVISTEDLYNIIYGSQFILDLEERYEKLTLITENIRNAKREPSLNSDAKIKRIFTSGAPLAGLREKVLKPLSTINDVIAVFATSRCEGECLNLADEIKDPYIALAEKYLSCQSFRKNFLEDEYNFDAIININLDGCGILPDIHKNQEKPHLVITTDYNSNDDEKILHHLNTFIDNL